MEPMTHPIVLHSLFGRSLMPYTFNITLATMSCSLSGGCTTAGRQVAGSLQRQLHHTLCNSRMNSMSSWTFGHGVATPSWPPGRQHRLKSLLWDHLQCANLCRAVFNCQNRPRYRHRCRSSCFLGVPPPLSSLKSAYSCARQSSCCKPLIRSQAG